MTDEENLYPEPVRMAAAAIVRRYADGRKIAGLRGFTREGRPVPESSAAWRFEVPARIEKQPGSLWEAVVKIAYRAWMEQGGRS